MIGSTPELVTSLFIQFVTVNIGADLFYPQICDPKHLSKKFLTSKLNTLLCSLIKKPLFFGGWGRRQVANS